MLKRNLDVAFVIMILILFFTGVVSYIEINSIKKRAALTYNNYEKHSEALNNLHYRLIELDVMTVKTLASTSNSLHSEVQYGIANLDEDVSKLKILYPTSMSSVLAEIDSIVNLTKTSLISLKMFANNENWYAESFKPNITLLETILMRLHVNTDSRVSKTIEDVSTFATTSITPYLINSIALILLLIVLHSYIIHYFVYPLSNITEGITKYLEVGSSFKTKLHTAKEILLLSSLIEKLIERLKR